MRFEYFRNSAGHVIRASLQPTCRLVQVEGDHHSGRILSPAELKEHCSFWNFDCLGISQFDESTLPSTLIPWKVPGRD